MLQWLKNLSQQLNPQTPSTADSLQDAEERFGDKGTEFGQPLTDKDYEFLFTQLLEGIAHGWQASRVERFIEALGNRGTKEQWVEWLQRYGAKILASSPSDPSVAERMIALGEITRSLPSLQKLGDTASGIGRLLVAREKGGDSDTWSYEADSPPVAPTPPPPAKTAVPTAPRENSQEIAESLSFPTPPSPNASDASPSPDAPDASLSPTTPSVSDFTWETARENGAKTITLDELLVKLQQDENLVQQVAQRLGLDTADPQEIVRELVRQINQRQISRPASTPPEGDDAEAAFTQGVQFYETGDFESAIAAWDKAIELKPDYHQAWGNRGLGLKNLGRYEDAIASYDRAIALKADFHKAWYNRGLALDELGRYEDAVTAYDRVLELKPDFHKAWYSRGNSLDALEKSEAAIASYDRAIELKRDFYKAWTSRGNSLKAIERYEEAVESYDSALTLKPDDYDSLYNRGACLFQLGRYGEAISSYESALQIKPEDYGLLWLRGNARLALGDYSESLADFDRAAAIKPDFEKIWESRGRLFTELGQTEAALSACDRAISLSSNPEAWQVRGDCLRAAYRFEEALECYDRALRIAPDAADLWRDRGGVLVELERPEEAIGSYDRALQLKSDRWMTWRDRSRAAGRSPEADLLLSALSPLSRACPQLNKRGEEGILASIERGLECLPKDRYPEAWGRLQQSLGLAYYRQGLATPEPGRLWRKALQAYEECLPVLTPEAFPLLYPRVLQGQMQASLGLEEAKAVKLLYNKSVRHLQKCLETADDRTKRDLILALGDCERSGADLALQQGELLQGLARAERGKSEVFSTLLDLPQLQEDGFKWSELQQSLTPRTAAVVWHLGFNGLTTFILKPDTPEPIVLGHTPNVVLNVVLSPSLRSRVELAKQSSEESLAILLELLGLDDENNSASTNGDRSELEAPPQKPTLEGIDEYGEARRRLQRFETWWQVWQQRSRDRANFSEHLSGLLEELEDILRIADLLREFENEAIDTLILVPDCQLHVLPLHVLLPDRFQITYLPGLKFATLSPLSPDGATLPDPWLKPEGEKANPTAKTRGTTILSAGIDREDEDVTLPHARLESAAICYGFAASQHLTNPQTIKNKILDSLNKGQRFCHFSASLTYNQKLPLQSAILFPGSAPLTLAELRQLSLANVELIGFSGVETTCGNSQYPSPEANMGGWGATLLGAGVHWILLPLWHVDSTARILFTLEFYRCLARESSPPVALKQTQLWLRTATYGELIRWYGDRLQEWSKTGNSQHGVFEEAIARIQNDSAKLESTHPPYAHPYYWGAFKLFGKP
ncbi:MAG: tetratricopeptide repeat protein [Cyanobacteria bacterium SBLK]|nr:tetratricopeptide repeat protein [Cyanobacteria bacterium SBLK]